MDFPYRPVARATRGSGIGSSDVRSMGPLLAVIARVAEDTARDPSVRNLHALGVGYLMLENPDRSVATFVRALTKQTSQTELPSAIRASRDVALLSDFSVAAIVDSQSARSRVSAGEAVEATQRAWRLSKTPATAWNRAVALQRLGFDSSASVAWREYLGIDNASPWADEARTRLRSLQAAIGRNARPPQNDEITRLLESGGEDGATRLVAQWPSASRSYIEEILLQSLTNPAFKGGQSVETLLDLATKVSKATRQRGGDSSFTDAAVDLCRSLLDAPRSARTTKFLAGIRRYLAAREMYRKGLYARAGRDFSIAASVLDDVGCPVAEWARLDAACCAFYANAYRLCLSRLSVEGDAVLSDRGWRALVATRAWMRGLVFAVLNRRSESITELRKAEDLFALLGERDNVAAIASMLAEGWEYLGDREMAERSRRIAISTLPVVADPVRRGRILSEAIEAALNKDLLWTALQLQDEAVEEGIRSRSLDAADAFTWRGLVWARLLERTRAQDDFGRAARLLPLIQDGDVRRKMVADLVFLKAAAIPEGVDQDALESAAAFYRDKGNRVRLSEIYRLQAADALRRNALDEGEKLLRRSIQEIRFGEQHLDDPAWKLIYTASATEVASAIAEEFLKRGSADRAFTLLEDIRSMRSLQASVPLAVSDDATALVIYLLGEETSCAWVVREGIKREIRLDVRRREVGALVSMLSERLPFDGLRSREVEAATSSLYDALIAPIKQLLRGATTVVIVPDDPIANVPFAALRDRRSGRYLVQEMNTVEAPSASAAIVAQRGARRAMHVPVETASVLVSDPSSNGIAPLPELEREIAAVRGVARSFRVVGADGGDVRSAAAESIRSAQLLHFAGHGEFDARSPGDSALVVGGSGGAPPTKLTAREIVARSPAAQLVVLSACNSGRVGHGMPSAGIAQWLVAVGVTSVVATVSSVDDAAAADLISRYYHDLRTSPDSASALRSAQVAAIERGDDRGWPAFVHIGAPRLIDKGGSTHEHVH